MHDSGGAAARRSERWKTQPAQRHPIISAAVPQLAAPNPAQPVSLARLTVEEALFELRVLQVRLHGWRNRMHQQESTPI